MHRLALAVVFVVCLAVLAASAIVGCSSSDNSNSGGSMMGGGGSGSMPGGGSGASPGGGMMGGGGSSADSYSSVGDRIYLTGVGADGQKIPHTAPAVSQGSLMMGGGGCGSCHGATGRGGTIEMMMGTAVKAPDITYDALVKQGFTDATIGRAIRDGLDESGQPLQDAMPRWQMSDPDVGAVIAYLKQLSAQ
jgi:mono/diheme cytochrome c family protein